MQVTGETTNLLKPNQVTELREELAQIEQTLNAPPHIRARISDPRAMQKRRKALRDQLDRFTPRPYRKDELDARIDEMNDLSDFIATGMPSSAEMRRNPAGAVGKHMSWEKRTERAVARYKHVGLRLLATGAVPDHLKHGSDVASVERLRALDTPNDLQDGAQIPKTTDYHFGHDVGNSVVFSDDEIEAATALDPEIAGQLALLDNDQRAAVKRQIAEMLAGPAAPQEENKPSYTDITRAANKHGIKTFGRKKDEILADLKAAGAEV